MHSRTQMFTLLAAALCFAKVVSAQKVPEMYARHAPQLSLGPTQDPTEIIERALDILSDAQAIRYEARSQVTTQDASINSELWGSVILMQSEFGPLDFEYRLTYRGTDTSGVSLLASIECDGTTYQAVDFVAETFQRLSTLDQSPSLQSAANRMIETSLLDLESLLDDAENKQASYQGLAKIGQLTCAVVHTIEKSSGTHVYWYFSTRDQLPKFVERLSLNADGQLIHDRLQFSKLVVNPPLIDKTQLLAVPEGFRELGRNNGNEQTQSDSKN